MSIRRHRLALLFPLILTLTACIAVGPDYATPQVKLPSSWNGAVSAVNTATQPAEHTALHRWWKEMNDPLLNELATEALAANLDLATAKAQLREARAQRDIAAAELGPSVDASTSASRSRSSEESGSGNTRELYNAGFDASWEADVFGGLRRGVEAATAELEANVEVLRDTQVSLVAEVALNYVELRTAQRRLKIAEERIVSLEDTLQLARWRLQAGLVSELDVTQARTELENTRASLPPLRTSITEASNRLAVLLGRTPASCSPA
ncbi:TolC family protein [Syntrophotalea acetylenivorans]|uniref:TolC family protein n=1 Tax=Syntrophotalea acetylenivorans TaxID=1842532 RepID=UPI000A84F881|nr:TolC family protein [Syntrophotalea acetylenivorans]